MTDEDPLVSPGEAARLLGLGRSTLSLYVREGKIQPAETTPGGHARYRVGELREQIAQLRESLREQREQEQRQRQRDDARRRDTDRGHDAGR